MKVLGGTLPLECVLFEKSEFPDKQQQEVTATSMSAKQILEEQTKSYFSK